MVLGCSKPEKPPQQESEPAAAPVLGEHELTSPSPEPTEPAEQPPAKPAPPPKIPDVIMTEALAATCKVKVGDPMPQVELPDLDGKTHRLKELYGQKLTVVLFWNAENPYALQELGDLQLDVFVPYGQKGVHIIAIDEKDSAETVRKKLVDAGAKFTPLLDSDGAYFDKVATEKLPRTYLLDADGKIVWFDLEYSTATRRNLLQAINVALGKG
jgi:peroxiredoxin